MSVRVPRSRWVPPVALVVLAYAAAFLVVADAGPPLRPVVVLGFLLTGPGLAVVRLARIGSPLVQWTLAVAVSLALDVVVSTGLLFARWWAATSALAVLVVVTELAALADLGRPLLRRSWA